MKIGVFGHSRILVVGVHGRFASVFVVNLVESRFSEVGGVRMMRFCRLLVCARVAYRVVLPEGHRRNIPRSDKTNIEAEEGWHSGVQVFI